MKKDDYEESINDKEDEIMKSTIGCTRVLLKVSGEALMGGSKKYGHDYDTLKAIVKDIKQVHDMGVQVCVVVGGGNIYRGRDSAALGITQSTADYMGMLATVINALALQNTLEEEGLYTRIQSAISITSICEPFIRRRAIRHMQKGRIVIFAAGIGNPFFTTDSAAVLRAVEMNCDILLKGTNVDGVYDSNPKENLEATRFQKVTYREMLQENLNVMDMAAIAIARENKLPIKVFSIRKPGNFAEVLQDRGLYTLIVDE